MPDLAVLLTLENLMAFLTLTALEIVLGIDNIIFIAILAAKAGPEKEDAARKLGLLAAVVTRILLLLCIGWVITLKEDLVSIPAIELLGATLGPVHFSGKDLILLGGGLFLISKATYEIHHKVEGDDHSADAHGHAAGAAGGNRPARKYASLGSVLVQVAIIDIVFSIDSVITAVGMAKHIPVMIAAVLTSVAVMLAVSGYVVRFIERHPTVKVLALSFLLLIGVLLVAEAFGQHIEKGYIYFAMAFALLVDLLQMRMDSNQKKRFQPLPTDSDGRVLDGTGHAVSGGM